MPEGLAPRDTEQSEDVSFKTLLRMKNTCSAVSNSSMTTALAIVDKNTRWGTVVDFVNLI